MELSHHGSPGKDMCVCVCVSFIITVSVTMQYAELYLSLAIYSHFGFYKEDSASEIVPMTEQLVN